MVILQYVENDFELEAGSGIVVFKMLVCEKQIILDLNGNQFDRNRGWKSIWDASSF